ncbi:MAG: hypothetical protein WB341_17435 [Terracidiphilus sp.]
MHTRLLLSTGFSILAISTTYLSPVRAQDANSAKSFLAEAYTHYGKGDKGAVPSASNANRYIHSSLLALMDADEKAVGTDVPISGDGDLFCDCQEWFGIYDLKIDVKMLSP